MKLTHVEFVYGRSVVVGVFLMSVFSGDVNI